MRPGVPRKLTVPWSGSRSLVDRPEQAHPDTRAPSRVTSARDLSDSDYRDGTLSREQIGRILGLSFGEAEAFLKARQAYLAYDEEDFKSDLTGLSQLGSR